MVLLHHLPKCQQLHLEGDCKVYQLAGWLALLKATDLASACCVLCLQLDVRKLAELAKSSCGRKRMRLDTAAAQQQLKQLLQQEQADSGQPSDTQQQQQDGVQVKQEQTQSPLAAAAAADGIKAEPGEQQQDGQQPLDGQEAGECMQMLRTTPRLRDAGVHAVVHARISNSVLYKPYEPAAASQPWLVRHASVCVCFSSGSRPDTKVCYMHTVLLRRLTWQPTWPWQGLLPAASSRRSSSRSSSRQLRSSAAASPCDRRRLG